MGKQGRRRGGGRRGDGLAGIFIHLAFLTRERILGGTVLIAFSVRSFVIGANTCCVTACVLKGSVRAEGVG